MHLPRFLPSLVAAALVVMAPVRAAVGATHLAFAPVPESIYVGVPFEMPRVQVPRIPARTVSILDFGAVGDGRFLNTDVFARAIDHLAAQGGGRVVVPRGIWLTGPIVLRDNINLHTEAGALVRFSGDRTLYPLIETSYEGLRAVRCQSPISAHRVENIALTGEGVFDGSGQAWRPVKREKMTANQWRKLVAGGGVLDKRERIWWPSAGALTGAEEGFGSLTDAHTPEQLEAVRDFLRPVMVSLRECRNILLDGPTFQNSPAWNIHPLMSENIIVRNLTVLNPWYSQNGDGIDIDSSRNVVIHGCKFDVGDDAICLKSGKNEQGRLRNIPTENLVARDNVVYHGHGGIIVGSEMSSGVRNVFVADLTFIGTDVGIRFKSTRGRGGVVENIHITDINMIDIPTEPIRFNLFYGGSKPVPGEADEVIDRETYLAGLPSVSEETPSFRNITIRNVICRGAGGAMWIQGLPEMAVQDVLIENVELTATRGVSLIDVKGFRFNNVKWDVAEGPALHLHNAREVSFHDSTASLSGAPSDAVPVQVGGALTATLDLSGLSAPGALIDLGVGANVSPGEIQRPVE